MKIETSRFGEVDVPEASIVTFPSGLVGLPDYTRYVVFDVDQDSGYQWLQSLEDKSLAVVIVPAECIEPKLAERVTQEIVSELEIGQSDPVTISVIVTVPSGNPDKATANLRAPLIVNLRTRRGKQVILHESIPLQAPLLPVEHKMEEETMLACRVP